MITGELETKKNERYILPNTNIYEKENETILVMDMPGVNEKNISIEVENDILTIEGKLEDVDNFKNEKLIYREYRQGSYIRKFNLNKKIDLENTKAKMKNGRLKIFLAIQKPEKTKIEIKAD